MKRDLFVPSPINIKLLLVVFTSLIFSAFTIIKQGELNKWDGIWVESLEPEFELPR